MSVTIRRARPSDAGACALIIHQAFDKVFSEHGFRYSSGSVSSIEAFVARLIGDSRVYGVVAELNRKIIGSNFLDERDSIRGLGPTTVDPNCQGLGAGRKLVLAVVRRARESKGIRLLQDSFNMQSLALYTSLGFEAREPIALVSGKPRGRLPSDIEVRPIRKSDLGACNNLCHSVHGFARTTELMDQFQAGFPWVAIRNKQITAYVSNLASWRTSHGVARTTEDMEAILLEASRLLDRISFLLPFRQTELFRWCLRNNFRVLQPMTYMSLGFYREPRGCYFPSIHS